MPSAPPPRYASVLLCKPLSQLFTYELPPALLGAVTEGDLVVVPFHARQEVGCVWALSGEAPEGVKLRPLTGKLEGLPRLTPALRLHLTRLASYYHAPLGEALRLALPAVSTHKALTLTEYRKVQQPPDGAEYS